MSDDTDWTLTTDQMVWMMEHHNLIERVMAAGDFSDLQAMMNKGGEYARLFGDMSFDEAYDRYESTVNPTDTERLAELQAAVIHFLTYRTPQSQDELRKLVGMDARTMFEG